MVSENKYSNRSFYQKSGDKSYLVMCSGEEPELPYQINMIRYNQIVGLLPVQFFIEDGEYRYFYDISCKESLADCMKLKKYGIKEIRTIMSDLYRCVQNMEEYLLDTQCLILEPEYLYTEMDNLNIQFCFYPDKKESFEKSLEKLFDYFLNQIDYQDEKTVVLVYGLYQKSREENVPLCELMKQFCEESVMEKKEKEDENRISIQEQKDINLKEDYCKSSQKNLEDIYACSSRKVLKKKSEEFEKKSKNYKWEKGIPYILDILGAFAIAWILWNIKRNYAMMSEKIILVQIAIMILILCGCGTISVLLSSFFDKETDCQNEKFKKLSEKKTGKMAYESKISQNQEKMIDQEKKNLGWNSWEENNKKTNTFNRWNYEDESKSSESNFNWNQKGMQAVFDEKKDYEEFYFEDGSQEDTREFTNYKNCKMSNRYPDDIKNEEYNMTKKDKDNLNTVQKIPATVVMNEQELFRAFNPVLISKNKEKYQDIVIKERTMMVGKVHGIADIYLDGKSISRVHARISQDENGCSITDIGSTNGTFVNGIRLAERQMKYLNSGDEVRFAEAIFEFQSKSEMKPERTMRKEIFHSHQISDVI